ncbi:MAG: acyl-CoA desaturase [Pseudomonadota bacterium]
MSETPTWISTERVIVTSGCSPVDGRVVWTPGRSLWTLGMTAAGVIGGALTFSLDAVAVFLVLSAVTLCAGHSVGMHRLLIHRSFTAPLWVERVLVWLGTLVGMAGPFGMIKAHDMRDWSQRQDVCHDHPAHRAGFWKDMWWQMHCTLRLNVPPAFEIEPRIANDRFYRFLEATWMAQQIPVALILFALGGWAWVFWGVCLRVAVGLHGHWLIGHFAHRAGDLDWRIEGLPVQGYNVRGMGFLTFGEGWHNNHHAFPHSARLGLEKGQTDPGWWLIRGMASLGLARDVQQPESQPERTGLKRNAAHPSGSTRPTLTRPSAKLDSMDRMPGRVVN